MEKNRICSMFENKTENILNVYFTAGYPGLPDTVPIIQYLADLGVDMIEIGMPYSDPLADGPTIQQSSAIALKNGMNLKLLFDQIIEARKSVQIPLILMGYFNQMMQYGVENFLKTAKSTGIDGLIIPDLPMDVYEEEFSPIFKELDLGISFLITPQTSDKRIKKAENLSSAFLYMVSQSSITGKKGDLSEQQISYFKRIEDMKLIRPKLIGFGIHNQKSFEKACEYANGAIIGSAFIRALEKSGSLEDNIANFIQQIR